MHESYHSFSYRKILYRKSVYLQFLNKNSLIKMTAMLFLINFCFFFAVLSLSLISCSTGINFRDLKFAYRKAVPYYDGNETLFSTTSRSFLASYGRCAVQCIEDLSCNALELCSVAGGSECRATTGLMKSGSQTNRTEMCKQYAMVRECLCQSRNV